MWNYPDYNRILIDKWKMLTMAQISTLEKERCEFIIRKKQYFEKNQINPAMLSVSLNKLGRLPAELQYYNDQLEKYDRMIYNMHCEMNWIRELEDGNQGSRGYKGNISDHINDFARVFGYWKD